MTAHRATIGRARRRTNLHTGLLGEPRRPTRVRFLIMKTPPMANSFAIIIGHEITRTSKKVWLTSVNQIGARIGYFPAHD